METPTFHPTTGCRTDQLFGIWLMEFDVLESLVTQAKAVDLKWLAEHNAALAAAGAVAPEAGGTVESPPPAPASSPPTKPKLRPYTVHEGGVGEMTINGTLTKYPTSFSSVFGGAAVLDRQQALRQMAADPEVKSQLITIESPGGSPNGLWDLGRDIRKAATQKPLATRIQDIGTSGGYLLAAHAPRIAANENASIGSIGVFSQLIDRSGHLEKEGIKVYPIRSGKAKGLGMTTGVDKDQIVEAQRRSDELWDLFSDTVGENRHLTRQYVKSLEARVFLADNARKMGLIDAVESHEETLDRLRHAASNSVTVTVPGPVGNRDVADPGSTTTHVAEQGATPMPKDLLAKIRELANDPTMSDDAAEQFIVSAHGQAASVTQLTQQVTQLKANQKEEAIAPALLDGFKRVAKSEVKLATRSGTITDAQEAQLVTMIDESPQVVAIPDQAGNSIISKFLSTAATAPKGIKEGEVTGGQRVKVVDPNPQNPDEFSVLDEATNSVLDRMKTAIPSAKKAG